ncbi:Ca2+-binding protein, RTX toxin [Herbaspirillum sp. YR522]|nr:Ca2+-binding protein, RTX toxin [Herbaspirillum sp. YR522]
MNTIGLAGLASAVLFMAGGAVGHVVKGVVTSIIGAVGVNIDALHSMDGIERTMHLAAGLEKALGKTVLTMDAKSLAAVLGQDPFRQASTSDVIVFKDKDNKVVAYIEPHEKGWKLSTTDQQASITLMSSDQPGEPPTCIVAQAGRDPYECVLFRAAPTERIEISDDGRSISVYRDAKDDGNWEFRAMRTYADMSRKVLQRETSYSYDWEKRVGKAVTIDFHPSDGVAACTTITRDFDLSDGAILSQRKTSSQADQSTITQTDQNGDGRWDDFRFTAAPAHDGAPERRIDTGTTFDQMLDADRQMHSLYRLGQLGSGTWGMYTDWSTRQLVQDKPFTYTPGYTYRPTFEMPGQNPIGAFYESRSAAVDTAESVAMRTFRILDDKSMAVSAQQLRARDANGDGSLADGELDGLSAWIDRNEDGVMQDAGGADEKVSLRAALAGLGLASLGGAAYHWYTVGNANFRTGAQRDAIAPVMRYDLPRTLASNYDLLRHGEGVFAVAGGGLITWQPGQIKLSRDQRNLVGTDGDDSFDIDYYRPYHGRYFNLDLVQNFYAGGGNDVMGGSTRDDKLWGGTGNDVLLGYQGHDSMYGEEGDDELQGHAGNDLLLGGAGNDRLFGQVGNDKLHGGAGDDLLIGFNGANEGVQTLAAGETDDDLMQGDAGNDQLDGGLGNDYLDGGVGDDLVLGGAGDDTMFGGAGHDELNGGSGRDTLTGGAGNDKMFGGGANDTMYGGDGNDVMLGFTASNERKQWLDAGETDDDVMHGGAGNDFMLGALGQDLLWGDDGDDELQGGQGHDLLYGGAGTDRLFGGVGDDVLYGGEGDDVLVGFTGNNELKQSLLAGESDNDHLYGGAGSDLLLGGLGHDILDGGAGADRMQGGQGDDLYIVNSVNDVILELNDAGNDTVLSSVDYVLGEHIEQLHLMQGLSINGTGNRCDNTIVGNDCDNLIDGVTGADVMIGGKGNDTYHVDNRNDQVIEHQGEGIDTVNASIGHTLGEHLENLVLLDFSTPEKGRADGVDILVYGYPKANELDYMQGNAVKGYQGTCAMVGIANMATQGGWGLGEADVVGRAIDNAWCVTDSAVSDYERGGSNYIDQQALLDSYGIRNRLLAGYDEQALANLVRGGRGVIVGLNAGALWGEEAYRGHGGVNHIVTVTGVALDAASGALNGFYIADSGRALVSDMTRYVAIDDFRRQADVANAYAIYSIEPIKLWEENIDGAGNALDNTLVGNRGNNVLAGGAGNDVMMGGRGDDTYLFNRGDGRDTISELGGAADDRDVLALGAGIAAQDLWFAQQGQDMVIDILGQDANDAARDQIIVRGWYAATRHKLEAITLDGGEALSSRDAEQMAMAMQSLTASSAAAHALWQGHRQGATASAWN